MDKHYRVKILICVDCKEEFAFTESAQEYFAEKGFTEDPKRCRTCYAEYKRKGRGNGGNGKSNGGFPPDFDPDLPPIGDIGNGSIGPGGGEPLTPM
ncbi:MAG: zinc-ribbon domain-containing protein [candidate division Zixibacteria bacterium]|nr:zinc-ribbon domain-containing protein [candidate division Zixibacteria bacterium]